MAQALPGQRNWLQICLMGERIERALEILPEALAVLAAALSSAAAVAA